jgi:hypothetical protein
MCLNEAYKPTVKTVLVIPYQTGRQVGEINKRIFTFHFEPVKNAISTT